MISTPTRGASRNARVLMLLAGFAVAAMGMLALAGGNAKAAGFDMTFDKGEVNLGFAFKGADILPAPSAIPGAVSNPNFNPNQPVSSTNSTTVVDPQGTKLFDYNSLNPATFTIPGPPPAGTNADPLSFTPLGCGTPVTFGLYLALKEPYTYPAGLISDPRPQGAATGGYYAVPIPNAGDSPTYYRTIARGAIVPEGQTIGGVTGPYPASETVYRPISVARLAGLLVNPGVRGPIANPLGFCANPANANVSGVNTDGQVEIQSRNFDFPVMIVPNPLDGSPVPITIESDGDVSGTYDEATGGLNIAGDVEVRVLTGLASNPLGSYCAVPLPGYQAGGYNPAQPRPDGEYGLTTSYMLPASAGFEGTPFTNGLSGTGALTGTFNVTQDSTSVGGANCATVNSVSKGIGGLWLGAGVDQPAPIEGNCAEFDKVGTFPNCETPVATIGDVTVTGPGRITKGSVANWQVSIPNTGNIDATGVKVVATGRDGLRLSSTVGRIAPKSTSVASLRARLGNVGKFTLTVKVTSDNAGEKTVTRSVNVVK